MPYLIREPKKDEILACIKVFLLSFGRINVNDLEKERILWTHLIDSNVARFLIAEENEEIIGIGGLFLFQNVGSIGYMGVIPNYRSRGIGTHIFKKLVKIGVNSGCKTISLYASKLGESIYKKFGFQGSYYAAGYRLIRELPELDIQKKNIQMLQSLPDWLLNLDKEAVGYERSSYLSIRVKLGAKILAVENEGYALLTNLFSKLRLGPLIATNLDTAMQIIKKGILLNADNLIIPEHPFMQNKLSPLTKFDRNAEPPNLKMTYGKNLTRKLDFLYAIGTYARG
ncbi:MAG: GNAT family N-acetyltransferase [Promethearchaeota archaeon]|jgi:ribosomal-protein-alanine N-acetyltransferase